MINRIAWLGLAPALALGACGSGSDEGLTAPDNAMLQDAPVIDNAENGLMGNGLMGNAAMGGEAMSGQEFANRMAASDRYEIEAGRMAQQKAQRAELKEFGAMMVTQHEQSTGNLKSAGAAASPAIVPQPMLNPEQERNLAALRAADGAAFDAEYERQQVAAHEQALQMLQAYAAGGDVPGLQRFARETQAVVQQRLERIQAL